MLKLLKLSILPIALMTTACATSRPSVSLGLGQITCPQSALTDLNPPPTLNENLLSQMSPEAAREVASRESWWSTVLAAAQNSQADTLKLCADVNHATASEPNIR